METVLNVVHVAATVFIIGPMAVLPMTGLRALRTGNLDQVAVLGRTTMVFSLVSLLVPIFGFGVLGMSDPKYHLSVTTPWILISLISYLVALAISLALVVPAMRAGGRTSGGVHHAAYPRIAGGSGVVSLLLLLSVVLMVAKP